MKYEICNFLILEVSSYIIMLQSFWFCHIHILWWNFIKYDNLKLYSHSWNTFKWTFKEWIKDMFTDFFFLDKGVFFKWDGRLVLHKSKYSSLYLWEGMTRSCLKGKKCHIETKEETTSTLCTVVQNTRIHIVSFYAIMWYTILGYIWNKYSVNRVYTGKALWISRT